MSPHPDPVVELLVQRQAVLDVVNRYAAGVDRRDMNQVASCFAPDIDASAWSGHTNRDDLIAYISGVAVFHTTMHMMGNRYIEINGDEATVTSHATLTHHGHHPDGSVWVLNGTDRRYVEELRRTDGGWVIVRRGDAARYEIDGVTGLTSHDPHVQWLLDRAALYDGAARRALEADPSPATEHFIGTHLAEIDGDAATTSTYVLRTEREGGPDAPVETTTVITWDDHHVRVGGAWTATGAGTVVAGPPGVRASDDPVVQELLDRAAIHDLVAASVIAVDRRDQSTRVLNNQTVLVSGDTAEVETYAYVVGERPWFEGPRRLVHQVARTDEGWRIVDRQVLDNRIGPRP